jgi:hypothetical protein
MSNERKELELVDVLAVSGGVVVRDLDPCATTVMGFTERTANKVSTLTIAQTCIVPLRKFIIVTSSGKSEWELN